MLSDTLIYQTYLLKFDKTNENKKNEKTNNQRKKIKPFDKIFFYPVFNPFNY